MKTKLTSIASCLLILMALVVAMLPALALPVSAAGEVEFNVPDGAASVALQSGKLPGAPDGGPEDWTFVGWTNAPVSAETQTKPATIYKAGETYTSAMGTTLYALYYNGTVTKGGWNLVTNASDLKADDQVVIAAQGYAYALGTEQASNNRKAVTITKNGTSIVVNNNVQILTLKTGKISGTFAFYTGSGYLYAASSGNNYLRTETTMSNNSSFKISITNATTGAASVVAQGSNTRNTMYYNNSSKIFACYSNAQQAMVIYKLYEDSYTGGNFLTEFASSEEKVPATVKLMVNGQLYKTLTGEDVNVGDYIDLPDDLANAGSYEFVGWSAEELDEVTEVSLFTDNYKVAAEDVTLHAVYKHVSGTTTTSGWIKTDLANIDSTKPDVVVITATVNGSVYAMSNGNGTSSAPSAVKLTVNGNQLSGDIADNIKWNITKDGNNFTVYVNGSTTNWLYCTATNNGVRVGNNSAKTFTIDSTSGYIKHVGTGRYLGIYNTQDWRCYTSSTATNIANQTFAFYVQKDETVASYAYTTSLGECAHEDCSYTYNNDGTHTVACNDCDYTATVSCSTEVSKVGNGQHKVICTDCEHETLVDCTYTHTSHNDGTHTATCDVCGDAVTSNCEYNYTFTESNGKHNAICALCHYSKTATPTYTNHTSNEDGTHTVDCDLCDDQHTIDCDYKAVKSGAAPEITTYTCKDCAYSYEKVQSAVTLNLLGKAYTTLYAYDGESLALPVLADMHEYTFIGWTTDEVDGAADADFFAESYTVNGAATLNALFALVVGGGSEGWVAKDLADIKANDVVVITMSKGGTTWALSSANGSSAAPEAIVVTVNGNALTGDEILDALKWNITNSDGNLTIYPNETTETWLYCTNGNNGVRVGTNDVKTFVIDSSSGYLKHTGTNRYVGVFIDNPDWRCYTNTTGNTAGQTLAFYVYDSGATYTYTTSPEVEHEHTFASARVNVGADLAMKFVVAPCCSYVDKVVFTMNGQTVEVTNYVVDGDKYVFTFANIAPQCMSDTITAELFAGDTLVDSLETSVKAYAEGILELYGDNETVVAMVSDMLAYGAAAQKYTGHNVDDLANEGVEGYAPTDVLPTDADKALDLTEGDYFFAAGVHFNNVNKIYAKFEAMSLDNLTVTVNGKAAEIVALGNGEYVVYSEAIYATEFANEFVFVILVDGEAAQSLTYTVNTYANAKQNSATMGELAVALYRYGLSAIAYVNQ